MIDDMTSTDERLNTSPHYACLACHAKAPIVNSLEDDRSRKARQRCVRDGIETRRGNRNALTDRLPASFVMEEATVRYFHLMRIANEDLAGKFDEDDFFLLLDVTCSPIWEVLPFPDLSGQLLDMHGLSGSTEKIQNGKLRNLIEKLRSLTTTEEYALVEACELVWRGYPNPLL